MLFAIVDIETTGSYAMGNGITEIAIIIHDGKEKLHSFQTLVNPNRSIPRFIQSLTGITDDMVANAPVFEEVAREIHELLQDKIFVAHNVNFDYSFVKHHLDRCGYHLDSRKLCTVRLARKIIPGYSSYSLGKLCLQIGIEHRDHHRAYGDALATSILFGQLVEKDVDEVIPFMLKGRNKEQYLPPNLPVEQLDSLPETPGVYYFYNAAGKIIYIGKAVNLNQRVKSHFANNKPGKQKQDFLRDTFRITHQPTATDLMAHILESVEIRKLWPLYNRSQRGYLPKFGLFVYEDQQGFQRLALDKIKQHYKPVHTFNTLAEGHEWLRALVKEFQLCPRLCNLSKAADCSNGQPGEGCTGDCPAKGSAFDYNDRLYEAVGWMTKTLPTMVLLDIGREAEEYSCILVVKGTFYGMGYIPRDTELGDPENLQKLLEAYQDNDYIRNLIYRFATDYPHKCHRWETDRWEVQQRFEPIEQNGDFF